MKVGSLFSGIDGLALGVQLVTGARLAWHAEVDPDACTVLARHWRAPNLGDVSAVDWGRVEPVDIIVGGFPCQDISLAGKGAGIDGERSGLWRCYVDAIRALRPRFALVENVAALVARGLDRVLRDLAESGYDASWATLTSAAVGAPHKRERLFILAADADGSRREGPDERQAQLCDDAGYRGALADADRSGLRDAEQRHAGRGDGVRYEGRAELVDDGEGAGRYPGGVSAGVRKVGARTGARSTAARRLNPDFVEWMMGFPPGWTAMVPRRARLRLLGNAVQPQVAMAAWSGLLRMVSA